MTNPIGIDQIKSTQLSETLNDWLADYMVSNQNIRGLYWNIKDENFLNYI